MGMGGVSVPVHPKKGESPAICKAKAEGGLGAQSFDEFGSACWSVYGKAVQINPLIHSIMEGFIITNFNFNTKAAGVPLPDQDSLPGPDGLSNWGPIGSGQGGLV